MHGIVPIPPSLASDFGPASGSHGKFTPGTGSEEWGWFYEVACQVCGASDPGYVLHLYTKRQWPLTSCRYYVARDPAQRRKPSPEFLCILFRSNHGEPFLRACMSAARVPPWFASLLAAEQRAEAAEAKLRDILEVIDRS